MRQFRNKPKHALYGVSAGATSLITSVASGFEGVVVRSIHYFYKTSFDGLIQSYDTDETTSGC